MTWDPPVGGLQPFFQGYTLLVSKWGWDDLIFYRSLCFTPLQILWSSILWERDTLKLTNKWSLSHTQLKATVFLKVRDFLRALEKMKNFREMNLRLGSECVRIFSLFKSSYRIINPRSRCKRSSCLNTLVLSIWTSPNQPFLQILKFNWLAGRLAARFTACSAGRPNEFKHSHVDFPGI